MDGVRHIVNGVNMLKNAVIQIAKANESDTFGVLLSLQIFRICRDKHVRLVTLAVLCYGWVRCECYG